MFLHVLQFRPNIELKETLLHEMIHAWMFLCKIRDQGDHGPRFQAKMHFINEAVFSDQEVNWHSLMNTSTAIFAAVGHFTVGQVDTTCTG